MSITAGCSSDAEFQLFDAAHANNQYVAHKHSWPGIVAKSDFKFTAHVVSLSGAGAYESIGEPAIETLEAKSLVLGGSMVCARLSPVRVYMHKPVLLDPLLMWNWSLASCHTVVVELVQTCLPILTCRVVSIVLRGCKYIPRDFCSKLEPTYFKN